MDYRLSGLSSRSFEQLTQSLATAVISPGIVLFGDGPDGGREATFEGRIPYPSHEAPWNGYLVVQAKFRQVSEGPTRDGAWFADRLRSELASYGDGSSRRTPEYYLAVTNVDLSSVAQVGAKDKAFAVLEAEAMRLSIRGYDIWDYRKLCAYIDAQEAIRHAYAAWITPGDALADIVRSLPHPPDFTRVLTKYLQKELLADQYANLEQAGRAADERIPIGRVFVDLDTTDKRVEGDVPAESPGFVASVLDHAATRLTPDAQAGVRDSADPRLGADGPHAGRLVLIGGPGQGKTTAGQFLCQLFRAAILRSRPVSELAPETLDALAGLEKHCGAEGIRVPTARRFPIRIALNRFAAALASEEGRLSLLAYVARQIGERTDSDVSAELLATWLGAYPWFLVLDGLDEVPASANRADVLAALRDFSVDVSQAASDLLILATTRPQGYNADFSPQIYLHRWLAPLTPATALHYATRLVTTRFSGDDERAAKILGRVQRAAENSATARLMRSPLQVTIMTTLVDRMGQPPQERWSLFNEYYDVIYQREVERDIPAAEVLRDYRPDIDAIHRRVGLLLQVESERTRHTDARLPTDRLDTVVEVRLREEGHTTADLTALKSHIVTAAAERLVFLVGLEADEVGFEIRSLQEFMAAEALMDGGDSIVADRLRAISAIPAWRNVFLFAAGKCFAERQHLRDTIHTICAELNDADDDPLARAARVGATVSLDLLEDGPPRRQPKYAELLTKQSLRSVANPPDEEQLRLAAVFEDRRARLYEEELGRRLESGAPSHALGAWHTAMALVNAGHQVGASLVRAHWPRDSVRQVALVQTALEQRPGPVMAPFVLSALDQLAPDDIANLGSDLDSFLESLPRDVPRWLTDLAELLMNSATTNSLLHSCQVDGVHEGFSLRYLTVDGPPNRLQCPARSELDWEPIRLASDFLIAPSRYALASVLRRIADIGADLNFDRWFRLPWPIAACVVANQEPERLAHLATLAEAGELGDLEAWLAAERRWQSDRVDENDLLHADRTQLPIDRDIGTIGFPVDIGAWTLTPSEDLFNDIRAKMSYWYSRAQSTEYRALFAEWSLFMTAIQYENDVPGRGHIEGDRFLTLLAEALNREATSLPVPALNAVGFDRGLAPPEAALMETWGERARSGFTVSRDVADGLGRVLSIEDLERPGIQRLLAIALPDAGAPGVFDDDVLAMLRDEGTEAADLLVFKAANDVGAVFDRIPRLARSDDAGIVRSATDAVRGRTPDAAPIALAIAYLDHLRPEDTESARAVIRHLRELLSRRTSGLENPSLWEQLGLFEIAKRSFPR
jgi:hypothetical protein